MNNESKEERNQFLRECVPGDELRLECADQRTRKVTVTGRIVLGNGGVVLKGSGHGTNYQIDVSSSEAAACQIRWASGLSYVRTAHLEAESDQLWSDTNAADLGIPRR